MIFIRFSHVTPCYVIDSRNSLLRNIDDLQEGREMPELTQEGSISQLNA